MPVPVYEAAGSAASSSSSTLSVPYPTTVRYGEVLLLQVMAHSAPGMSNPSGWTQVATQTLSPSGFHRVLIKTAAGTESGSLSVSISGPNQADGSYGRIYRFSGGDGTTEAVGSASGTGATISDVGVTTTSTSRMALQFVCFRDNQSIGDFTGETGGDWTEAAEFQSATGLDGTIQMQTAAMPSAGTVNGGSVSVSSVGGGWGVIGFAILSGPIPVGVATETDTALSITPSLTFSGIAADVGVATETDTALSITASLDGPDLPIFAAIEFGDSYEDLTTVLRSASIRRGRPFNLDRVEAGTADVVFLNGTGDLDPSNPDSPYYPNIKPLSPIRLLRRENGVTYERFTGPIERFEPEWVAPRQTDPGAEIQNAGYQFMRCQASDAFELLSNTQILSDAATMTTALTGSNNDLTFTATEVGGKGDDITVAYVVAGTDTALTVATNTPLTGNAYLKAEPTSNFSVNAWRTKASPVGDNTAVPLTVSVAGTDITVNVATNSGGAATSTAAQIKAALEGNAEIAKLVTISYPASNDGSGVVTAMSATHLEGGKWVQELTGTRINRVLDLIGWDSSRRQIDSGQAEIVAQGFSIQDNTSALAHLQDVADSELGYLFVSGAGDIVYHDSAHRSSNSRSTTSQATFSDDGVGHPYYGISISLDKDRIVNQVTVTGGERTSIPQTAEDTDSQDAYRVRSVSRSTRLAQDEEALAQATRIIDAFANPETRFDEVVLRDIGADGWADAVLAREIGDMITIRINPPGHSNTIQFDAFVEEITDTLEPGMPWATTFKVSPGTQSTAPPPPVGDDTGPILDATGNPLIIDTGVIA